MSDFLKYCNHKFPTNWEITDNGNGSFHFRDNLIARGMGYVVEVQEEIQKYEVIISFENFAKELSNHALQVISKKDNPLKRLLDSNKNIWTLINKHFIEINLDPDSSKFDNWSLNLIYKRSDIKSDAYLFSDLLISFILFLFPYSVDAEEEGLGESVIMTKYERSHLNRSLCIAFHGYNCKACNVNLKKVYGDIAREFIHVHHINLISESGVIKPDPINDFVPLCPNCHSIAHLKNPPYTIEEIQKMLITNGTANN